MHFEPSQRDPDRIVGIADCTRCRSITLEISAAFQADRTVPRCYRGKTGQRHKSASLPVLSSPEQQRTRDGSICGRRTRTETRTIQCHCSIQAAMTDVTRSEDGPGVPVHVGGKVVPEGEGVLFSPGEMWAVAGWMIEKKRGFMEVREYSLLLPESCGGMDRMGW